MLMSTPPLVTDKLLYPHYDEVEVEKKEMKKVPRIKWYCGARRFRRPKRRLLVAASLAAMFALFLATLVVRFIAGNAEVTYNSPWYYYCDAGHCRKAEITENVTAPLSLSVCQLFCGEAGALWPKPTGHTSFGNFVAKLDPDNIVITGIDRTTKLGQLLQANVDRLKTNVKSLTKLNLPKGGYGLTINALGDFDKNSLKLTLNTSESYTLVIRQEESGQLTADITSDSYFGLRYGVETLSQLIVYDDLHGDLKIARDVFIKDGPVLPYRGVVLDTSRNFMDKASILRTIEAMAMSKLNSFHWHISDTHSFPYVSRTWPKMAKYGAYSSDKIYTPEDIKEIVNYALVRGVRVVPEIDAPAHVGAGWEWVGDNATVCFGAEPWMAYCVEPPCGQLNPTVDKIYDILEGLYKDMLTDFDPDLFHMGGDEVNFGCWSSSENITNWMAKRGWDSTDSSFFKLWDYFQTKAYERLTKANNDKEMDSILWTSGLTSGDNLKYLDPKKYIIQIWTNSDDSTIRTLVEKQYRVIFSNYDALYLDCGFAAWIGAGNNWCSPYIGWQKIYGNDPFNILTKQGLSEFQKQLVLGGEAALWSEQVDSTSVDSRLWPRAAALAERLWSNPASSWSHAMQRMLYHRERLVQRGILADSLQPEWCLQNQGSC